MILSRGVCWCRTSSYAIIVRRVGCERGGDGECYRCERNKPPAVNELPAFDEHLTWGHDTSQAGMTGLSDDDSPLSSKGRPFNHSMPATLDCRVARELGVPHNRLTNPIPPSRVLTHP